MAAATREPMNMAVTFLLCSSAGLLHLAAAGNPTNGDIVSPGLFVLCLVPAVWHIGLGTVVDRLISGTAGRASVDMDLTGCGCALDYITSR